MNSDDTLFVSNKLGISVKLCQRYTMSQISALAKLIQNPIEILSKNLNNSSKLKLIKGLSIIIV